MSKTKLAAITTAPITETLMTCGLIRMDCSTRGMSEAGLGVFRENRTPRVTSQPNSIALASDEPSPSSTCQEGGSAYWLGLVDPGTYSTKVFQPELSFTVPEGWKNVQDEPGNLLLNRRDDSQDGRWGGSYIGVYQNVRAASLCKEEVEPGIGTSSSELAAWYRAVPGLEVVGEGPASVGGLTGISPHRSRPHDDAHPGDSFIE